MTQRTIKQRLHALQMKINGIRLARRLAEQTNWGTREFIRNLERELDDLVDEVCCLQTDIKEEFNGKK